MDGWMDGWAHRWMDGWIGYLEDSSNPDADVSCHYVHQPETGEALELLDVELQQAGQTRPESLEIQSADPFVFHFFNLIKFAQV